MPIAIVGVSCRLPGGIEGLDDLRTAVWQGRDLVGSVPRDRFDAELFVDTAMPRPGKSYTAAGGFLDNIKDFDAAYFGISPKEAAHMDPQHRLLLELAAEAFDDASISPESLAGRDTAVYVGISDSSYGALQMVAPRTIGPYTIAGAASSIAANRLSHAFDLRGPSMAVDTACSSSLIALDRACRTLWDGTSRTALCGGVNVLLSPFLYVGFSQAAMLSRRGVCASFSADADGFVRAEGGGMVLLKLLADAQADGDRVHGVILGSASNCDGRTLGIALPDARAQEDLLREVYADFGVHPDELVYFEAHGTGTPVGDPVEARAIGRALGMRRITGELPIGSVKTNVGHLEPASGIAGLCKALLVLKEGSAPASRYADRPHPDIDFTGLGLRLPTENHALPATGRPVVGVNSFGFGGANAHVIVAAADPAAPGPAHTMPEEGLPVVVSARTPAALTEAAVRMSGRLAEADPGQFYDIAYTSCLRRGLHEYRTAVFARTPEDAARRFTDSAGEGASAPVAAVSDGRVAFVFAGNGSQWAGMAADLMATGTVFRETVAAVDAELAPLLGWSVTERLTSPVDTWRLEATEVAQPLLFAVQLGIMAVLRAQGVRPDMVVGHSVGEIAAACACGALTLPEAARLVTVRSRAQARAAGGGRMAAVGLSASEAAGELRSFEGRLEIAGVNSPRDVTVAGEAAALTELGEGLRERGVFFRDLGIDYAFHSRAMEPLRPSLLTGLADLAPGEASTSFYSTVTGAQADGPDLDAEYWWHNVRRPVLFMAAVEQMLEDGADVFVEIGPHPVLRTYLRRAAELRPRMKVAILPTLRRAADGPRCLTDARAALVAAGARTDWKRYFPHPGRAVGLPSYPWQREPHWGGGKERWTGAGEREHPLLGARTEAPLPTWTTAVEPALVPWLSGHRVGGSVVMPATAFIDMALSAGSSVSRAPAEVEYLDITKALVVPWEDASGVRVQTALDPEDGVLRISSGDTFANGTHARARVRALVREPRAAVDLDAWRQRCPHEIEPARFYASCAEAGLGYGSDFQVLRALRVGEDEALGHYSHDAPGDPYTVHPALLDGALQTGAALLLDRLDDGVSHLPATVRAVRAWRTPAPSGWFTVREVSRTPEEVCWDIAVVDPDGTVAVELEGCRLRRSAMVLRQAPGTTHTVLRAAPHPDTPSLPSPLPGPEDVVAACAQDIADLRAHWRDLGSEAVLPLLKERFLRAFAGVVARALPDATAAFTPETLSRAGFDPERYARLERRLVPALEEHGLAVREPGGGLRLTGEHGTTGPDAWRAIDTAPEFVTSLALVTHQEQRLENVLRGEEDPLGIVLDETTGKMLEQLYDTSPYCRFHNRLAQALVRDIVRRWPADRPLRVLEVGSGTGGLTAALLPLLPPDRTRYHFTDTSTYFLPRAEARFGGYDFVEYHTFDLDTDPAEQGFTAHSFDLVVAGNALHTARHLADALRAVAGLLTPGGHLLAVEPHTEDLLLPIFGTLDSLYTQYDTELRPDGALLPRHRWPEVLRSCGFARVAQTGDDRPPNREATSVMLAATPAVPARTDGADALVPAPGAATHHLVVTGAEDADALGTATVEALNGAGRTAAGPLRACATVPEWTESLRRAAPSSGTLAITLLTGGSDREDPAGTVGYMTRRLEALRTLTAACQELPESVRPELWMVMGPEAAPVATGEPEETPPVNAALWGAVRSLANEHPELSSRSISLTPTADTAGDARRIVRELLGPSAENEIVLTARGRFVPREQNRPTAVPAAPGQAFRLKADRPGLSYRLSWQEMALPVPGPGQVLVEVRAAALNYRDLMQVVGLLPQEVLGDTPSAAGWGLEASGVVVACGEGVHDLRPGDRVAGFAPDALASHTVADARGVWPVADELAMTHTEAATLPVACATVQYGLGTLARLRPGETVLVHGGAGGVGLAALRYAGARGGRVIATAGSAVKRDLLRALGVEHVLDSRRLDFADQIRRITGGRGVDVVLNSLAGEGMVRSLELLAPGGRFVEMGKRDLFENKPLLLRPFLNNIAFFGMDLTKVLADPGATRALLTETLDLVAGGTVRPLPHSVFPAARVTDAFQLIQHSRHIGKVVVAFDPLDEPPLVEPAHRAPDLDAEGTYLITGGTSGLGAATAGWLADRGARHVALVSRRGPGAPEAAAVLAGLRRRGVTATAHAADVTDAAAMRDLVDRIDAGGRPLRGVVHSAMHLDDDDFLSLSAERMAAVLAPKIAGATVLDALTRDRACDLFLMYSSFAAAAGNVKQVPYVAANYYLEALCRQRRQRGLPGLAVGWGAIGGTGFVQRNNLAASLASVGMDTMTPAQAFRMAETLLATGADAARAGRIAWDRVRAFFPTAASPRWSGLVPDAGDIALSRGELVRALDRMSRADGLVHLTEHLTVLLAGVLQMAPEDIHPHRRIEEYGIDSLMGAELLVKIHSRCGIEIPPMELLNNINSTTTDLARLVYVRLGVHADQYQEGPGAPPAPPRAAQDDSSLRLPHQPQSRPRETARH
ncbi:SDR family NAD(P)-dependent oxidoreductase [Streptomyces sp. LP05-1]|uniref:SDR family NAD(P)-dependent oxidoreductase n=1 Tax=Streptomyces pyxinae TaxID=2970734 RepID=A0ABT2CI11_9ACTN|nr:type I polyketide synthase [Streptomyces sp. LP05-1]MCS0637047.1 SDR family NAD(P)-dependent oxidoreductase [Streptomyces sp. LP05-1]